MCDVHTAHWSLRSLRWAQVCLKCDATRPRSTAIHWHSTARRAPRRPTCNSSTSKCTATHRQWLEHPTSRRWCPHVLSGRCHVETCNSFPRCSRARALWDGARHLTSCTGTPRRCHAPSSSCQVRSRAGAARGCEVSDRFEKSTDCMRRPARLRSEAWRLKDASGAPEPASAGALTGTCAPIGMPEATGAPAPTGAQL